MKYFFIILLFLSCDQDTFMFNQNNLRNIFTIYIFFHSRKIFFYYMNFPFITFLVSISGFPFVFTKVRFLDSVRKLNSTTWM